MYNSVQESFPVFKHYYLNVENKKLDVHFLGTFSTILRCYGLVIHNIDVVIPAVLPILKLFMIFITQFIVLIKTQTYVSLFPGIALFISGMVINIHADHILRNLRKPGETGYKIPQGKQTAGYSFAHNQ